MKTTLVVFGILVIIGLTSCQQACEVTFSNKGAYTLAVSQSPASTRGQTWKVSILAGQHRTHDVALDASIRLHAKAGKGKTCSAEGLCGRTVTCTGTTLINFDCDCTHA